VKEVQADLLIVHGDRVEALAGAIVGSLNNILVGHIEGGEVSGTIDELIRHSISKLSHIHFVANDEAKNRLLQMGELENQIYVIGSPDVDIMFSENLPNLDETLSYYDIAYENYNILMYHPITTERNNKKCATSLVQAVLEDDGNYIVIKPNNDMGSKEVNQALSELENNSRFTIFPSLRFEYFLVLLKHCNFIIGNSSAGVREAPYYGVNSIDIGNRQLNRVKSESIIHTSYNKNDIISAIQKAKEKERNDQKLPFGKGQSDQLFIELLKSKILWAIPCQKQFKDRKIKG
jgi:UDP-N-acetylglucosamine 2-epimerase (hydrolysing)